MTLRAFVTAVGTEALLYLRGFFGPFFTFVFPLLMLVLFGSIYGNEPTPFYNGLGAMDASVPAYLGLVVAVNGLMTLPLTLAEYQDKRVYRRFDATPCGKGGVILAQITLCLVSSILGAAVMLVAGVVLYDIQITGSLLTIAAVTLLSLTAMFAIGFFIASVLRSVKAVNLVSYIVFFVMMFISGATLPHEMFPEGVKAFAGALPLTHVVRLSKDAFQGVSLLTDWVSLLVLLGVTAACGLLGLLLYRRRRWA
ncbi:MAG: ABC transporter permease [Coriobacteriales bacterium]|jgi:ABC-2 type transport system permease protein|nr:ABC transporter permease [Coriobacteriales bacterium]